MQNERDRHLLIVCIAVFVIATGALIGIYVMYQKGQEEYENLRSFVEETEDETNKGAEPPKAPQQVIDFAGLKAINPDIVAWIKCEKLGLDYPVVKGSDNDFYLTHTFSGEEHIAGCIFMDFRNQMDFSDDNTILYGHNMKDGSMFGSFSHFKEKEATITVYTPDGCSTYQMIDNRVIGAAEEPYFLTSYTENDFSILRAAVDGHFDEELTNGDHLLTLSTCNGNDEERHIILAKRITESSEHPETQENVQTKSSEPAITIIQTEPMPEPAPGVEGENEAVQEQTNTGVQSP